MDTLYFYSVAQVSFLLKTLFLSLRSVSLLQLTLFYNSLNQPFKNCCNIVPAFAAHKKSPRLYGDFFIIFFSYS